MVASIFVGMVVVAYNPYAMQRANAALEGRQFSSKSLYAKDLEGRMRRLASLTPARESYKKFDYELMARITAKNNALREQRKAKGVVEPYKRPKLDYLPDTAAKLQAHKDKIARVNEARKILHAKYAVKLSLPRAKT